MYWISLNGSLCVYIPRAAVCLHLYVTWLELAGYVLGLTVSCLYIKLLRCDQRLVFITTVYVGLVDFL